MNKEQYKVCIPVDNVDNAWLQYYYKASLEDRVTEAEERKYERLGYKYTDDPNWYYEWNKDEERDYIVVDKEN